VWVVQAQGLSGGVVAVYPDKKATFKAEENIIVGNVCLYGAVKVRSPLHSHPTCSYCHPAAILLPPCCPAACLPRLVSIMIMCD